jgi:EAP30/Vps36 family
MCAAIGVDPLVSNVGMWAQLLGIGDFYSELGVQVIEACLATRCAQREYLLLQRSHSTIQNACRCEPESAVLPAEPSAWPSGRARDAHGITDYSIPPVSREHNGGLLDLETLHRSVERRRGSAADPVSLDDILQAIKNLKVCSESPVAWKTFNCQELGCCNAGCQNQLWPWRHSPEVLMQDDTAPSCRCLGAASG